LNAVREVRRRIVAETSITLAVGGAALAIAFALMWFGRLYSHSPFMNTGAVFVTYPALVLVFISFGLALMFTAFG
jgi:hypothetical protein